MVADDPLDALDIAQRARDALCEKQALDPVLLDVRGLSSLTDYILIVSGTSPPHLKALHNAVPAALKDAHVRCYRKTGRPDGGWMVLDYVTVVIHVFERKTREYYAIEELWSQAPTIPPR